MFHNEKNSYELFNPSQIKYEIEKKNSSQIYLKY